MNMIEQTETTAIGISQAGEIEVHTVTVLTSAGVEVGRTALRTVVLPPGSDVTGQAARVQAMAAAVWTPDVIAQWQAGSNSPTIEAKRAATWIAIRHKRDDLSDRGGYKVNVGGVDKWFHSDAKSKIQQLGLKEAGAGLPANLQWKTMDGTFVAMTPTLAAQVFAAAMAQDAAIFQAAETHRLAMEAAVDPLAYDYSAGWPQVFAS